MEKNESQEIDGLDYELPLCPSCMAQSLPEWDFCPHCNAPLGPCVGLDPFKRIFTMRFLLYQGTKCPNRPIIIYCLWGYYLSFSLPYLLMAATAWQSVYDIFVAVFFTVLLVPIAARGLYLLYRNASSIDSKADAEEIES